MSKHTITGILLDEEHTLLDISELCEACLVNQEVIIEMVEHGFLQPQGHEPRQWQFTIKELLRSQRALKLQRDLQIDLAGATLALELLEEIKQLRHRLSNLEKITIG